MLFGHRRGAIARLLAHRRFGRNWREQQLLRTIYDSLEAGGFRGNSVPQTALTEARAWSPAQAQRLVSQAAADGLVIGQPDGQVELTAAGRKKAVEVTRSQRFWEEFLIAYPDQAGSIANLDTDSIADYLPEPVVQAVRSRLQAAGRWPAAEAAA
jgi:Mn-dependent DtxR family transcriptional regulator